MLDVTYIEIDTPPSNNIIALVGDCEYIPYTFDHQGENVCGFQHINTIYWWQKAENHA